MSAEIDNLIPKVYIAGPWKRKDEAAAAAAAFDAAGFAITQAWWLYDNNEDPSLDLGQCATNDINGVLGAHFLVLLNLELSEGKAVETGVALITNKCIVLVGEPSNIFHHLEAINKVADIPSAITFCQQTFERAKHVAKALIAPPQGA